MISIEHIRKKFCNRLVVDDVSLVLEKENVHAFIGSSGSGKTTLLKMIAGILEPDEGLVKIDDEVMTTKSQMHLSRLMGYVMQDGGLFPHFTAKGNVSLQARVLNWSLDKIEQRMSELSSMFNIDSHILEQYPSQLSGGQKQRIAVMRGLFLDPNILLLDEPLGALDPLIRANLQEELKKIFQKLKKLVILVTHDLA
ncbi:MAG: ATP-binding cassette domain-containing protein [Bdellovibrionales bacterium]|nr:ATP-binding cassette domain-containing protein [Bdellovibrionales bacterium]